MRRVLSVKEILRVLCPLCGAKPGRKCQLGGGEPRNKAHRDRRWEANESAPDDEMWIRPNAARDGSMGADVGWKAWNFPAGLTASSSSYLRLANVVLGAKKSD